MNGKNEKVIKEFKGKVKVGDKDKYNVLSYVTKDPTIEIGDDKEKTFDVSVKEIGDDGKETGEAKTVKMKVKYNKGWWTHQAEIKEIDSKEVKSKTIGLKGMGSFRLTFWGAIAVGVLAIGALIWWWIASSRSEDKEEESL